MEYRTFCPLGKKKVLCPYYVLVQAEEGNHLWEEGKASMENNLVSVKLQESRIGHPCLVILVINVLNIRKSILAEKRTSSQRFERFTCGFREHKGQDAQEEGVRGLVG